MTLPEAASRPVLSDNEAVTLRRIAFGESDVERLRRADLERLASLHLITAQGSLLVLTVAGRRHFDSLPRATFATRLRRGEDEPPAAPVK
jgi:hypothetical protein